MKSGSWLETIIEGAFFAIGFFFIYYPLEALMNKVPAWRRMRASKAAKQLRMTKPKEKETAPSNS